MGAKIPPVGEPEFSWHIHYDFLKGNHKGSFHTKKLEKLIATFGRYRLKSLFFSQKGGFGYKTPLGCPQGITTTFLGQNNIKNEISTIKLLRVQIFSKIQQLLNYYLRGGFFNIFGVKNAPQGGELEFSWHIKYDFLKGNHKGSFHTKN